MSMNLNGSVFEELPAPFALTSRALHYGDGLFETIRVFEGRVPFMPLHWERLEKGLRLLGFEVPANWSAPYFESEILKIAPTNARVRLTVWRSPGGLYHPADNSANFLITATPLESGVFNWNDSGLSVRMCERVRLPSDALSGLKTLGAIRYVAAIMEAREKGVDDVIVLNQQGHVCEASSSNVLWIKGRSVFTPLPTDGQVTGTFQKILCEVLREEGVEVVEKASTFASLLEADEVFLTNAIQGIRWVRFLEGKELTCEKSFYFNKLTVKYLKEKLALI